MARSHSFPACLKHFSGNRKASISVVAAASITALASLSALGLELGRLYLEKRKQQAANDLAAIAAAANPSDPEQAVALVLKRNGIEPAVVSSLRIGAYRARAELPVDQRFSTVATDGVPAAELKLSRKVPLYFAGLIGRSWGSEFVTISTTAVGASNVEAAFSAGSKLASLQGGIANRLLGAMLGTNVNLSVMDYEALASANVKLLPFFDALAARASLKAVTYDSLLEQEFTLPAVFGAMGDAGGLDTDASAALSRLVADTQGLARKVRFKDWIALGSLGSRIAGTATPDAIAVNVLDLVSATARVASAGKLVSVDLAGNLPTGTALTLSLAIGEPKQYSGFVSVGAPSAVVETAQTRLLLQIKQSVAGLPDLVNVPLYLEVASGRARLTSTSCANGKSATLAVRPSLISARIADIDENDLPKFDKGVGSNPVDLLKIPLIRISALGSVEMSNTSERNITFSKDDIAGHAVKTVSTEEALTTLLGSLLEKTDISVSGLSLTGALSSKALKEAIAAVVPSLDKALVTVLTLAGVKVGALDVQVQDVRCNSANLVR